MTKTNGVNMSATTTSQTAFATAGAIDNSPVPPRDEALEAMFGATFEEINRDATSKLRMEGILDDGHNDHLVATFLEAGQRISGLIPREIAASLMKGDPMNTKPKNYHSKANLNIYSF